MNTSSLVSTPCGICKTVVDVTEHRTSHGDIHAWSLVCGHVYLLDSQCNTGTVTARQYDAAQAMASHISLIDLNGNRTPSFQRLCAQFNATLAPRYRASGGYITNVSEV